MRDGYTDTKLWNYFNACSAVFFIKAEKNISEYGESFFKGISCNLCLYYTGYFIYYCVG